jgi:hypothetical protein
MGLEKRQLLAEEETIFQEFGLFCNLGQTAARVGGRPTPRTQVSHPVPMLCTTA